MPRNRFLKIILITLSLLFSQTAWRGEAEAAADPGILGGSGTPVSVFIGRQVDYNISVKNQGDESTGAVNLQFNFSSDVTFTSSSTNVTCGGTSPSQVTCGLSSNLAAGILALVRVTVTPAERGELGCVVQLSTTGADSNAANNIRIVSAIEVREWGLETIDGNTPRGVGDEAPDVGQYASLVLNGDDPLISFYEVDSGDLLYAGRNAMNSSAWDLHFINQPNDVGQFSKMAISPDKLHFIFRHFQAGASENNLRYIQQTLGSGELSTPQDFSTSSDNLRDLAVNQATGTPHLVFRNSTPSLSCGGVTVATELLVHRWLNSAGTAWNCARVTTGAVQGPSALAIDSDGRAHTIYAYFNSGITRLRYRRSAVPTDGGSPWTTAAGGITGESYAVTGNPTPNTLFLSIDTESDAEDLAAYDVAHICFYDSYGKRLVYLKYNTATDQLVNGTAGGTIDGTTSPSDAGDVGKFCKIAVDETKGMLHVSYYDAENKALKYAWKTLSGGVWSKTAVDDAAEPADVGQYSSVAVDSKGFVHIGYYDVANKNLKYAVTAGCGNRRIDSAETCDDGNTTAGDGCSATCQTEGGGGGVCNNNGTCDPGEASDDCPADCGGGGAICGNNLLETGEACDDGNIAAGDGCSSTCTNEVPPSCGDGIRQADEACDDGNIAAGDGCSSTCTNEVPPSCGDGIRQADEACDDGNIAAGDGCSATCRTEAGSGAVCGNSRIETGEECDDGNTTAGDGCNATCKNEGRVTAQPSQAPVIPVPGGKPTRGGGCTLIPLSN
ncbi:MAG: DUF4215 domain-containing protein [Deltaproteobacteria bacterium]|nr:DUF4215 domain-containing protein [Deltaproteobacteria bacterium]